MVDKNNKEELLRKFFDGDLSREDEQKILHMIADDRELIDMLRFERMLYKSMGHKSDPESFNVPDGFTDKVMLQIASKKTTVPAHSLSYKLKSGIQFIYAPCQLSIRPVWAIAALLLIAFTFPFTSTQNQNPGISEHFYETSTELIAKHEDFVWIRFVYIDNEAHSMAVAGDFSNWDPIPLTKETVGDHHVWAALIPVPKEEHRYMFIKDEEHWLTDPLAEVKRDDGFGNQNAILFL